METSAVTSWRVICHHYSSFTPPSGTVLLHTALSLPCLSHSLSWLSNQIPIWLLHLTSRKSIFSWKSASFHVSAISRHPLLQCLADMPLRALLRSLPFFTGNWGFFIFSSNLFSVFSFNSFMYLSFHFWAFYRNITYMQKKAQVIKVCSFVYLLKMNLPCNQETERIR